MSMYKLAVYSISGLDSNTLSFLIRILCIFKRRFSKDFLCENLV